MGLHTAQGGLMHGHPIHHISHTAHDGAVGDMGAVNHDDGQTEFACGGDLGDGAFATCILGDDDFGGMVTHQGDVTGHSEGAAGDGDGGLQQGQVIGWCINEAQQIMVLGGNGKGREMLAPDGQKHPARRRAKGSGGADKVWHMGPVVGFCGDPWRAFKGEQGNACGLAGHNGVGAHLGGVGMGGINDMGYAFAGKKGLQSFYTAKAADAGGQGLGHRGLGPAGIGINGIGVVIMQGAGEKARFGRAAQKKDAHDV